MFQNGDKVITVLHVVRDSADTAQALFDAKKRVAAGQDIAGWKTPAYVGTVDTAKDHVAIVGVVKDKVFVEAKVLDVTQKTSDLSAKMQAVMKAFSARP
jgi:hypothetical protein